MNLGRYEISILPTVPTVGPPVTGIYTEEPPTLAKGDSWTEQTRARRKAFTRWDGEPLYTLTLPMLLEGFDTGTSVEGSIERLEGLRTSPGTAKRPPACRVFANYPRSDLLWVLQGVSYAGRILATNGVQRQFLTCTFLEYVPADYVESLAIQTPAAVVSQPSADQVASFLKAYDSTQTYTVKQGETLLGIIAGLRCNKEKTLVINNIRDVGAIKVGQVLRIVF